MYAHLSLLFYPSLTFLLLCSGRSPPPQQASVLICRQHVEQFRTTRAYVDSWGSCPRWRVGLALSNGVTDPLSPAIHLPPGSTTKVSSRFFFLIIVFLPALIQNDDANAIAMVVSLSLVVIWFFKTIIAMKEYAMTLKYILLPSIWIASGHPKKEPRTSQFV